MAAPEPGRLERWMAQLADTHESELDCAALENMLEELLVIASEGADVAAVLPQVAVHLRHCPECGDIYDTIFAMERERKTH